jgi:hypothetical protein
VCQQCTGKGPLSDALPGAGREDADGRAWPSPDGQATDRYLHVVPLHVILLLVGRINERCDARQRKEHDERSGSKSSPGNAASGEPG